MFNAEKNSKIIGYLIFISSLINLVVFLGSASEYTTNAVILSLIGSLGGLAVGFGLIKNKLWAVYGIGALALYRLLLIFYNYSVETSPSAGELFMLALNIIVFFWFFSAKKKFQK